MNLKHPVNLPDAVLYKLLSYLSLANQTFANTAIGEIQFDNF